MEFRAARDFLLSHRTEYETAYRDFEWPQPEHFNWALDWFDTIAAGNDRPALWIIDDDDTETRLSFAELSARSDALAAWLRQTDPAYLRERLAAALWVMLTFAVEASAEGAEATSPAPAGTTSAKGRGSPRPSPGSRSARTR